MEQDDIHQMKAGATVSGKPGDPGQDGTVKVTLSWDGEDFSAHIGWPDEPGTVPLGTSNLQGAKWMATRHMTERGYKEIKTWRETRAAAAAAAELPHGVLPRGVPLATRMFRVLPGTGT